MKCWFVGTILWVVASLAVSAQGIAKDHAGNVAYDDGWQAGDNGGSGWQGWSISPNGDAGVFVGTSQSNGFNNGNIDTAGRAWGLWAGSGSSVIASRSYGDGSVFFGPGYTIKVDLDTGFADPGSQVGFSVIGSGDSGSYGNITVYFPGGGTNYIVSQGSWYWITEYNTGIPFNSDGLHVEIDILENNDFACRLTPAGGSTVTIQGNSVAGNLHVLEFFNRYGGAGSDHDLFFNTIKVLPPPRITGITIEEGTNVTVHFLPRPDLKNALQAGDSLAGDAWADVATNLTGSGEEILQAHDALPSAPSTRCYRIVAGP